MVFSFKFLSFQFQLEFRLITKTTCTVLLSQRDKRVSFDSFSLREMVAEGRMRVNLRMFLRKGRCSIAGLIIIAVTLGLAKAVAADWQQLLGPRADGTSSETGLLSCLAKRRARRSFGKNRSAPATAHRPSATAVWFCFTASATSKSSRRSTRKTSKPVWRHASPTRYRDPFGYNNGPRCTPLLTTKSIATPLARRVCCCVSTSKPASRFGSEKQLKNFKYRKHFLASAPRQCLRVIC